MPRFPDLAEYFLKIRISKILDSCQNKSSDMNPLTTLATTAVSMIFTGIFEGIGQDLQKQLTSVIHKKFKISGTEKLLERAENKPTKTNLLVVEAELITQMIEDREFTKKIENILNEIQSPKVIDQVMASDIKANKLETENMTQKARGNFINQTMGSNLEVSEDVKFGNLIQEGNQNV